MKKDGYLRNRFCGKTIQGYEGEDMILYRIFTELLNIKNGFYIDVGAFRPRQYSNTWYLKKRLGFSGINIEPSKKGFELFKQQRPNDINIQCLCGEKSAKVPYYYNNDEPSLSKIDEENRKGELEQMDTLKNVCIKHKVLNIDLLDVDVEGYEFEVLKGHNWELKPKVIILEINDCKTTLLEDILMNSEKHKFIKEKGYSVIAKTQRNMIYIKSDLSDFNRR